MRPEPESVVNNLSNERRDLWSEIAARHAIDELKVRRLIRKFDDLIVPSRQTDSTIAIALHEQGYLYAYLGKKEISMQLFDDAVVAGLMPLAASISKAHALYICGDLKMSKEVLLGIDIEGVDQSGLAGVADGCMHLGLFTMAADLYVKAGKQSGEVSQHLLAAAEIMNEIGATDDQVSARLETASKIIQSMSGHPHIALDVFAMQGEGILYRFMVKGPTDHLMAIDSAIEQALGSKYNDAIDQYLSIGVAPHEEGAILTANEGYYVSM
jgi:hypothetical protein